MINTLNNEAAAELMQLVQIVAMKTDEVLVEMKTDEGVARAVPGGR